MSHNNSDCMSSCQSQKKKLQIDFPASTTLIPYKQKSKDLLSYCILGFFTALHRLRLT